MKTLLHLALLFGAFGVHAQEEFSFQLYFEDAAGNKDTVTVGYDANATNGIDVAFGEINTISEPWESDFEVRITDKQPYPQNETFRTKKSIVKKRCGENWGYWPMIFIDIKNPQFPYTITWDNTIFQDECIIGTRLVHEHENIWFDVGIATELWGLMKNTNIYSVSYVDNSVYHYKDSDDLPVYSFWLRFGGEDFLTLHHEIVKKQDVSIYPNPADNLLHIEMENTELIFEKITVYDFLGRKVLQASGENKEINIVDISNLNQGQYFLEIETANSLLQQKFIKN